MERLKQALAEQEMAWMARCKRAGVMVEKGFQESEVYKKRLCSAYNGGQEEMSKWGCQAKWINEAAIAKMVC